MTPLPTAYLAVNGDDATAQINDPEHPFRTQSSAEKALAPFGPHTVITDIGYLQAPTP